MPTSERFTGKNARLYVATSSSTAAIPAYAIKEFEYNTSFDAIDVTSFGDDNMTYLAGATDSSGSFSGFVDKASGNTFQNSINGDARKFYFYIDLANDPTKYIYGTAIWSWTESYSRAGASEVSGSWNAAGGVYKTW